jgi:two-component system CheB/CheR fusion protein
MTGDGSRVHPRPGPGQAPSRQAALGELCRRLVMESYAPAAVLINRRHECLYSLGPTDRYLRVAPGHPTHDLLALARQGLRARLAAAIQQATEQNARCRRRRSDERRWRHRFVQHRRAPRDQ